MDIIQYTLISVSVAATLFSIVLIVGLIAGLFLFKRITDLVHQIEKINGIALEATQSLKDFVDKTGDKVMHAVETFTTFQGAREVVSYISEALHKDKGRKDKSNGRK